MHNLIHLPLCIRRQIMKRRRAQLPPRDTLSRINLVQIRRRVGQFVRLAHLEHFEQLALRLKRDAPDELAEKEKAAAAGGAEVVRAGAPQHVGLEELRAVASEEEFAEGKANRSIMHAVKRKVRRAEKGGK